MISASEWRAYNEGVREVSQGAEGEVVRRLLAWRELNPAATAAECREAAKLVFGEVVQSYDSVASSFAAEWYDYRAEQAGARLRQAVTSTVYSPKTADEVARYQARKLAKGDFEGFARACGEYAANDVLRSLNATVMANAERDRREGVRFARVPTGWETCTFCLMLASRGAVYHTRKTAGEFEHFHRRCDCKVVPGFEDDPMAELVEGHDPKTYKRLWRRMNSATIYEKELYVALRKSIASEANALEAAMQDLFKSIKKTHRYIDLTDRFLRRFEGGGSITSQYWAKPEGKEMQLASWLAGKGHDVEFLTPSSIKGSHTPDMWLDGELWEIKRVETGVRKKMKQRVSEGLRQAPNVIVDLSINAHDTAALELAAVGMLDDPRAEKIMVIRDGVAMLYAK